MEVGSGGLQPAPAGSGGGDDATHGGPASAAPNPRSASVPVLPVSSAGRALPSSGGRTPAELAQELKDVLDSDEEIAKIQRAQGPDFTREKLLDWIQEWKRTNPNMTDTQLALTLAVLESPQAKSPLSAMNPRLCKEVTEHAELMASTGIQGHQGFDGRYVRAGGIVSEIASESWPNPGSLMEAARNCVNPGWFQSPGHRFHMDGGNRPFEGVAARNASFCYDMRKNENNGTWYCSGLMQYNDMAYVR